MRFDTANITLELLLFAVAVAWWMVRSPAYGRKRTVYLLMLWDGLGPSTTVTFPLDSLCVNVASLAGTILSDSLRPSQAVFSVALVLHDAWPLLFSQPSEVGGSPAPVARNWVKVWLIAMGSTVVLVLFMLMGWTAAIHVAGVACGYLAGAGAVAVAMKSVVDFGQGVTVSSAALAASSSSSSAVSPTPSSPTAAAAAVISSSGSSSNNNSGSSTSSIVDLDDDDKKVFPKTMMTNHLSPSFSLDSSTSNATQHVVLIATYFFYAVMLISEFGSVAESGPWFVYCAGSVFVECVKFYWVQRARNVNVVVAV